MSAAPPNSQGIRSVNNSNLTPAPPTAAEIVYVDIYTDPKTKQECILWEDIQLAFYNALHVRHKARIIPFVKDSNLKTLKPFRIAVIPGEVLDIVVGSLPDTTPKYQQPSVLRQIKQQAARLPMYNPFSTMRPISPTHPSSSLDNAPFAPAGNNFARTSHNSNRQQVDELVFRTRNKALAHKYAKEAMTKLAVYIDLQALHAKGDGAPGDFWKALECYLKGVRQSHAHAQVSVGDLFSEGQGVSKDPLVAMGWYLKATFQGDTNAQRKLETLRRLEPRKRVAPKAPANNSPKDLRRSRNSTRVQPPSTNNEPRISNDAPPPTTESSDQILPDDNLGDKNAQVARGDMYRKGKGVSQDYQVAMKWYLKAADQGDARAEYIIGAFYYEGRGVSPDYTQAKAWFLKSANQGYPLAQYGIGILYELGHGVPQDNAQAMNWYRKAADQGHVESQFNVGVFYHHGHGVPQNYTHAMEWYLKSAKQGHIESQDNIGSLYHHGHGVPQNYTHAMEWYLKSAKQGYAPAQIRVGFLYFNGEGVPQNSTEAMVWLLKAASQGNPLIQYYVGEHFYTGQGVPQSYATAAEWFQKAADGGFTFAKRLLENMKDNVLVD